MVLRRSLIGYEEITVMTSWDSEEDLRNSLQLSTAGTEISVATIQRESPNLYQVVLDARLFR